MIAEVSDVRKVRAIAQNVADQDIARYIEDAELQDVLPAIGAEVYFAISEACEGDNSAYREVLEGGAYRNTQGLLCYSRGLISAISYLAYGRVLLYGDVQITASGAVKKTMQYSTSLTESERVTAADGARKMGLSILKDVAKQLDVKSEKCAPRKRASGSVIKKRML